MVERGLIRVPIRQWPTAAGLVLSVNSGQETFLMDLSQNPQSFIINPIRKRGGRRLHIGDSLLVTNESRLWLVTIRRTSSYEYFAYQEGHPSRYRQSDAETTNRLAQLSARVGARTASPRGFETASDSLVATPVAALE